MKPEERKVILHTFKNIKKYTDQIGGIIDSCVRDIEFFDEDKPKDKCNRSNPGNWP